MASGKTTRKQIPFPLTSDADKLCADQEALADKLDTINEGHQDFLQAGVMEASDWSFTATINSITGMLGSGASTGGKAWLPDSVVGGALMRSVTSSMTLSGIAPSLLPTTGKYVSCALELTPSAWGAGATVTAHSGAEKASQAEAEAAPPATTTGKLQVRRVVIKNTAGTYSIITQEDVRPYATRVVGDIQIVKGRALIATEGAYTPISEPLGSTEYVPSTTRLVYVTIQFSQTAEKELEAYVYCGGTVIAEIEQKNAGTLPNKTNFGFLCPPGVAWKIVRGAWAKATVNYLLL